MERLATVLRNGLRGELIERDARGAYASDFGGLVTRTPALVVRPAGEEDVGLVFRSARAAGVPVVVRGAGHSCGGQTLTDGVVLVWRAEHATVTRVDAERVEVTADSPWLDVERRLNALGCSVPVLTDYLDLTVGGTLSVGGYGVRSVAHGAQVDHVERVRLISYDGEARWCSRDENPALFRHALAGFGGLGLIERVVLRTVPWRPVTHGSLYPHSSLGAAAASVAWLAEAGVGALDGFQLVRLRDGGLLGPMVATWFGVEGDDESDPGRLPEPLRARPSPWRDVTRGLPFQSHERRCALLAARRGDTHLWIDHVFDFRGFEAYLRWLDAGLRRPAFGRDLLAVYGLAIRRGPTAVDFPFEASGVGAGLRFGVGAYWFVPRDEASLARARDEVTEVGVTARALGGRPYLYGAHGLDAATMRAIYGDAITERDVLRGA